MPGESPFSVRPKRVPGRDLFPSGQPPPKHTDRSKDPSPPGEQFHELPVKNKGTFTDNVSISRLDKAVPSVTQSKLDDDTLARYKREMPLYEKLAKLGQLSLKEQEEVEKLQDAANSIMLRKRTGEQDKKPYLFGGQPSQTYSPAHKTSPSIEPLARYITSSNKDRLRALNSPPNLADIDTYDREAEQMMDSRPDSTPSRRRDNSPDSVPAVSEVGTCSTVELIPPKATKSSSQEREVMPDDSVSNVASEADSDMNVNEALEHLNIYNAPEDIDPGMLPTIFDGARLDRPGHITEKAIAVIVQEIMHEMS